MDDICGYTIMDVELGKARDWQGQRAPKHTVEALRKAGISSFSFNGNIDWNVLESDVKSLSDLFNKH